MPTPKRWVYVTRVKGWIREHDPATESGLVPRVDKPEKKE